jgi:nucleotide-binding universal stress UspA family protein
MTEVVLVATGGGPGSRTVLDWVIARGRLNQLNVDIITVEESDWLPLGADERAYRTKYAEVLTAGENRVDGHHGISLVSTTLARGETSDELVRASQFADLLVVASSPIGPLRTALHATVALQLAEHTKCALIVVPADWSPGSGNVVVGVDRDNSSDTAIRFAVDEARRTGRTLELVHAWSPHFPLELTDKTPDDRFPRLKSVHEKYLEQVVARARALGPDVEITSTLQSGQASEVLAHAARSASILVLGTHGRGVLPAFVLGSVGEELIAAAKCVIAIVRPDAVYSLVD